MYDAPSASTSRRGLPKLKRNTIEIKRTEKAHGWMLSKSAAMATIGKRHAPPLLASDTSPSPNEEYFNTKRSATNAATPPSNSHNFFLIDVQYNTTAAHFHMLYCLLL